MYTLIICSGEVTKQLYKFKTFFENFLFVAFKNAERFAKDGYTLPNTQKKMYLYKEN